MIMPDTGIVPARPWFMAFWFEQLRADSDRLANISDKRLILTTDVEWERNESILPG